MVTRDSSSSSLRAPALAAPDRRVVVRSVLPLGAGGRTEASHHPILLRGLGATAVDGSAGPTIVKRTEAEFLPALFAALSARRPLSELGLPDSETHPDDFEGGRRRLFQPVHRAFNCVVLEAVCQRPGFPRVDPRYVLEAGCVVRRVVNPDVPEQDEAWLHDGGAILGWQPVPTGQYGIDPNPQRRLRVPLSRDAYLNARLAALLGGASTGVEVTSPLFVAAPEVCAAAERTVIYGVVPVSSSEERSAGNAEPVDPEVVAATTPGFLRALGQAYTVVAANRRLTAAEFEAAWRDPNHELRSLADDVRLLAGVWRAFDDTPEARALVQQLNRQRVLVGQLDAPSARTERPLGDYLGQLVRRLLLRTEAGDVLFPHDWRQPSTEISNAIRSAAQQVLTARLHTDGPRLKRFDEPGALYRLHCFVRVRGAGTCPPELHWSVPSQPFSIVPWWDSGGAPVHTISLPDLTPANIRRLKPNVAFVLPPKLAAVLNQDPKKLKDGEDIGSPSIGLGWICSFSIPIITLCAFIVLNIFLSLFQLVFSFMFGFSFLLSLKICLPFPKVNSRPRP